MSRIIKSISYIFHPIFIPLFGLVLYFWKSPKFFPFELVRAKIISVIILTIILPILIYFLLKTLGKVKSIQLKSPKERILPLLINIIIVTLIIKRVLPNTQVLELYYFFIGSLISTMACLILAFLKFKPSLHMVAISGIFVFIVGLSIHFSININGILSSSAIIIGAVATSRLVLKAHTTNELLLGMLIGLFPQLTLLSYWL